jgi:hypothetical protein
VSSLTSAPEYRKNKARDNCHCPGPRCPIRKLVLQSRIISIFSNSSSAQPLFSSTLPDEGFQTPLLVNSYANYVNTVKALAHI